MLQNITLVFGYAIEYYKEKELFEELNKCLTAASNNDNIHKIKKIAKRWYPFIDISFRNKILARTDKGYINFNALEKDLKYLKEK